MNVLLVVVCTVAAGLLQAQAQVVVCLSEDGCNGLDLGVTLPRGCCVDNPAGRSYRAPGGEECIDCTVFGFFEESFTGVEQAEPYEIQVGYSKVRQGNAQQLTFIVRTTDGTAREGSNLDYEVNSAQVTFNAANSSANVTLNQDNVALEPNETFILELDPTGTLSLLFFIMNTINITIVDSDVLNVSFERETYFVNENDGSVEVCLSTNIGHAEAFDAVIEVVMKGVDNPAASDSDFDSSDQTISFARSDNSSRGCVQIVIIDDSLFEGDEQFLLRLRSFSNSQILRGEISEACITIREDDSVHVNLTSASIDVAENDPGSIVCVTLEGALALNVSVTVMIGPKADATDPATDESDYNSTVEVVTFAPSDDQISQEMCIPLPVIDDLIANEANEQFSVVLIDVTPTANVGINETCVTIIDDDIPEFSLVPESIFIVENNTEVEVCIVLTGTLARNVEVTAETGPKSGVLNQATAGLDYATFSLQATFTSEIQMMCAQVQIMDDELANEANEQFSVSLVSAIPTSVFRSSETCITIMDNDVPEFSLTPLAINVTEGTDTEVQICITISGSIARNVIVTAETVPKAGAANQATAGSDYQNTTITVTFEPIAGGEIAEMMCGNVPIIDDMVPREPAEQFSVRLISANPVGNFNNDASESCIIILDDDDQVVCHANANLVENPNGMLICVCRNGFTGDGITNCTELVCHANANLVENPNGTLICVCRNGFTGDGITNCTDIDECCLSVDDCSKNAMCRNTEGSFECICNPGYTGDGKDCEDIDECMMKENVCDEFVSCTNIEGSYTCQCTREDGSDCITRDVEESSDSTRTKKTRTKTHTMSSGSGRSRPNRSATRTRSRKSKCTPKQRREGLCGCDEGYSSGPNGCIDIDECANEELNDCGSYVQCMNLPGSFKCVCTNCIIMDEELTNTRSTKKRTKSSRTTKSTKKSTKSSRTTKSTKRSTKSSRKTKKTKTPK